MTDSEKRFQEAVVLYENKKYVEAVSIFETLANEGDADAQHNMGFLYENGEGVPCDKAKAVEWFRKAAEQGNAPAQFQIGIAYWNGEGVPHDETQGVEWFCKAAEQGNAKAYERLEDLSTLPSKRVPREIKEKINILLVEWYTKAAEQGDFDAQLQLGIAYLTGKGVPQDDGKSIEWFLKAEEHGRVYQKLTILSKSLYLPRAAKKKINTFLKELDSGKYYKNQGET